MNALAKLLHSLLGWNYDLALWICSGVVLIYVLKGGLTSAIYTEVLQFFMIVLGFAPVVYLGLQDVGGLGVIKQQLTGVAAHPLRLDISGMIRRKVLLRNAWSSAWKPVLAGLSCNPHGRGLVAIGVRPGIRPSFVVPWMRANFLVVQRAMAAKNMSAARRTR